jgi:hypothetical protein
MLDDTKDGDVIGSGGTERSNQTDTLIAECQKQCAVARAAALRIQEGPNPLADIANAILGQLAI